MMVLGVPSNAGFAFRLVLFRERGGFAKQHHFVEVRYWPKESIDPHLEIGHRNQLRTSHALCIVESNAPSEHSAPSNDA